MGAKHGQYFWCSNGALDALIRKGNPDLLLAYMALAMGRQKDKQITSWGASAVAKHFQPYITHHRAKRLISTLTGVCLSDGQPVVMTAETWNQRYPDKKVPLRIAYAIVLVIPDDYAGRTFFPNILITGGSQGMKNSPLLKLLSTCGRSEWKLTLNILLILYRHYRPADYFGCDPGATCFELFDMENSDPISIEIPDLNYGRQFGSDGFTYWLVPTKGKRVVSTSLVCEALGLSDDKDATQPMVDQIYRQLDELQRMGLVYRAHVVFSSDPSEGGVPLYPLWISDRYKREQAKVDGRQGLYSQTLSAFDAATQRDIRYELGSDEKMLSNPGFFAVVADTDSAKLISILRPRYVANTDPVIQAESQEAESASEWGNLLSRIFSKREW